MTIKAVQTIVILGVSSALMSACTFQQQVASVGYGLYDKMNQDSELLDRNYSAADYLAGQTLASVSKQTPLYFKSLTHAENTGMGSPFGAIVAEQISARFAQLGYNVRMPEDGPVPLSPTQFEKGVTLTGTYYPRGYVLTNGEVRMSLRMIDNADNRMLGAFDYTMPLTMEISQLLDEQPTVYRLPETNE
ncbi:MAG: hypothetical protein ACLFR0_01205 [Alphaproteobacteria bacterium]